MQFDVIVEIQAGPRNTHETDRERGILRPGRPLGLRAEACAGVQGCRVVALEY